MDFDKNISKDEINKLIIKWSIKTFGADFKFRPKQKETIIDIIHSWLNNTTDVILEAPTGSGKSIVAITVAGVLSEYFNKRGYILISDLSLLEQYKNDIDLYLPTWAVIKGQQSYTCLQNGLNFNVGVCKLKGCTSYLQIRTKYSECSKICEYLVDRERAMIAPVTVCTYSFWLIQQNYVKPKFKNEQTGNVEVPFDTREFVICDEAHKLVNIIQNHFSPKFGKDDEKKFFEVIDSGTRFDKTDFKNSISKVRENIINENDKSKLSNLIDTYVGFLSQLLKDAEQVKTDIANGVADSESGRMSKEDRTVIYDCEFIKDHHCKFDDFNKIIKKIGPEYIVKNDTANNGTITFNCINESYLMNRTFHANCMNKLYMSATIGDAAVFAKNNAIKNYTSIKLPIVFDYTKSPIFYVPEYKMSFKEKDINFPKILEMTEGIVKIYPDKKGIIQTGSYSFAKQIYENASPSFKKRILLYEDSTEKQDLLDVFKFSKDKILVGPSLIEGLSLNDDLCRFQIIFKIPYPSLADKFIAEKQKFNPPWYSETAAISMLQGVGRGVRNENDWCVTFILDACFSTLMQYTGYMFPQEFKNRIQIIPSTSLIF